MQPENKPFHEHFIQFLNTVEDGHLLLDLGVELEKLVRDMKQEAASRGGKPKGSLSVTFGLTLDSGIVEIAADIRVKPPKRSRGKSIMYPTKEGQLTANNPRQLAMDFDHAPRTVNPSGEIRQL